MISMHKFHQDKSVNLPTSADSETSHPREVAMDREQKRRVTGWSCTVVLLSASWYVAFRHILDASIEADTNQATPGIAYENGEASIVYMEATRQETINGVLARVRPLITELNTLLQSSGTLTPPKSHEIAELAIEIRDLLNVLNEQELRATRLAAMCDVTEEIPVVDVDAPKLAERFSMAKDIFEMDPSKIPGAERAVIADHSNLRSSAGEIHPSWDYYRYHQRGSAQ